jgi:hypothetical protein
LSSSFSSWTSTVVKEHLHPVESYDLCIRAAQELRELKWPNACTVEGESGAESGSESRLGFAPVVGGGEVEGTGGGGGRHDAVAFVRFGLGRFLLHPIAQAPNRAGSAERVDPPSPTVVILRGIANQGRSLDNRITIMY